jgi:threonyl-tRNA synthetase
MPVITLPDGSQKRFDQAVSVAQVAASIGGLAKAALAGKVDGVLVDTSTLVDHDASLSIVTDRDPEGWKSSGTPPRTCWPTRCRSCFRMRR